MLVREIQVMSPWFFVGSVDLEVDLHLISSRELSSVDLATRCTA